MDVNTTLVSLLPKDPIHIQMFVHTVGAENLQYGEGFCYCANEKQVSLIFNGTQSARSLKIVVTLKWSSHSVV
jgi:hypothetical protein